MLRGQLLPAVATRAGDVGPLTDRHRPQSDSIAPPPQRKGQMGVAAARLGYSGIALYELWRDAFADIRRRLCQPRMRSGFTEMFHNSRI